MLRHSRAEEVLYALNIDDCESRNTCKKPKLTLVNLVESLELCAADSDLFSRAVKH